MKTKLAVRTVAISELHEDPANLRRHDEKNLAAIKASLARFGQQKPIVVDKGNVVRAGNGTLAAAKLLGWETISIVESSLSDVDLAAFSIADNRTSDLSDFDEPELARFLEKLEKDGVSLGDDLAFDPRDMAALNRAAAKDAVAEVGGEEGIEEGPIGEVPERVNSGDVWMLGDHRLMCGDSTKTADVGFLVATGGRPALVAIDAPYRVGYKGISNHPYANDWKNQGAGLEQNTEAEWDASEGAEDDRKFLAAILSVWSTVAQDRAPFYLWHAFKRTVESFGAFEDAGLLAHQPIIWDKTRIVPTHSHYGWQTECAIYGWKKGFMPEPSRKPPSSAPNLWQVSAKDGERIHHTQKPTILWERPILYHTREGEWIADGCVGSGTAIIAAEKHGRRCVAMEIDPRACDRILARYEAFTGRAAKKA